MGTYIIQEAYQRIQKLTHERSCAVPTQDKELQKAWDKILELDRQLTVANGRLATVLQELDLVKSHVKQHATDMLKLAR